MADDIFNPVEARAAFDARMQAETDVASHAFNKALNDGVLEAVKRLRPDASEKKINADFLTLMDADKRHYKAVQDLVPDFNRIYAELDTTIMKPVLDRLSAEATALQDQINRHEAGSVLNADDPTALIEPAIRRMGYGGDDRPVLIGFLAGLTRLLTLREQLAHIMYRGLPSSGKSKIMNIIADLTCENAKIIMDASSSRAIIYSPESFAHVVIFLGEIDSIPSGDEQGSALSGNPGADAREPAHLPSRGKGRGRPVRHGDHHQGRSQCPDHVGHKEPR